MEQLKLNQVESGLAKNSSQNCKIVPFEEENSDYINLKTWIEKS